MGESRSRAREEQDLPKGEAAKKDEKKMRGRHHAKCHKFMTFQEWADVPEVQETRMKLQGLLNSETKGSNWQMRKSLGENKSTSRQISITHSRKSRGRFLCIHKASKGEKWEKVESVLAEKKGKGRRVREKWKEIKEVIQGWDLEKK